MLTTVSIAPASTSSHQWGALAGGLFGATFLAWLTGTGPLDPTNIDWVMKGDWVPHHFGWHYFRSEPWHWPPGSVHGYYAPLGTSIGLTDSIPLAAYLLKPLSPLLPQPFQYLGLWLLLCFALQGALGARLIGRYTAAPVVQALGAMLFVLVPTLLARVGHAALCAHWLILWALLVASRQPERRFRPVTWAAFGLTSGMIQPYLAAMVLPILAVAALTATTLRAAPRLLALGSATAATVAGWWLSGLFVLQGEGSLARGGLGYYSMNLLAPISPFGWSAVLPELPIAGDGQAYEGFQYLGLGVLLLVVAAGVIAWRRPRPSQATAAAPLWTPAMIGTCLLMAAFALSPTITFGRTVIVDLNGPWSAPLAVFRSSGRFFWPLAYLTLTWAVVTVATRLPRALAVALVGAAVVVQAVDLHAIHADRRSVAHGTEFYAWPNPFTSSRWAAIAPTYAHLALVPPPQCGATPQPYESAVRLASAHGLTLNAGVIAREDEGARRRYCADFDAEIDALRLRADTLYIVSESAAGVLTRSGGDRLACGAVDTVWTCVTAESHARWRDAAPFDQTPSR
jgi:Family of unknown function (DUF6311)